MYASSSVVVYCWTLGCRLWVLSSFSWANATTTNAAAVNAATTTTAAASCLADVSSRVSSNNKKCSRKSHLHSWDFDSQYTMVNVVESRVCNTENYYTYVIEQA